MDNVKLSAKTPLEPAPHHVVYLSTTVAAKVYRSAAGATANPILFEPCADGVYQPIYLVTPNVFRWFEERIAVADAMASAGDASATEWLNGGVADVWCSVADWAYRSYQPSELAAAKAGLPRLPIRPDQIP